MTKKLLYIDDDFGLVRLAQKAFDRAGYEVVHASDPEMGLVRLAEGDISGIILDHYLQSYTGLSFLEELNRRGIPTPVVYVTGSSEAKIAIEALKAGAADYVIKTVGDEFWPLLLNSIEQALENAELRAARQLAEQEILAAKERAEILLAEVNHRVANSLALVAALIRLQVSTTEDAAVKNALAETQARISAIAGMHRSLYTSDDVRSVDMNRYLSALVSDIAQTMSKDGQELNIECSLDSIAVSSDRAVSAGMIVTELLTNAIKYAYPDGAAGAIRVKLERIRDSEALLVVEDDGAGYNVDSPAQGTGLGSRIVASMAKSIGDGIRYVPLESGTRAEVHLSLHP
ncbi:response regulator [Rhizobium sp. KVB221]|uniref:histidine kinase n=1 Tax=Rhizobium setariae TaxID=2801340 RepID=A0A937CJ17_9HYPH|nr:histidine kinase dimerization/phosphoacceptor domain -containing protein [Rhizobium setariae]MBL0370640.1 response regulator [Rhizobium setariae]